MRHRLLVMRTALTFFFVLALTHPYTQACESKITTFYKNAELEKFPAEPFEPINKDEALKLEEQGDTYFVQVKCISGEPISLMKRWNKKMYFEIKYLYQDGRLIGQKSTNANGETNEFYVE